MGVKKNQHGHQHHGHHHNDKQYFTPTFESQEVLTQKDKDNTIQLKDLKTTTEEGGIDYEPYDFRAVEHPTSNLETLIHLLKGSLGTGILAMPMAFKNSGYLLGLVATAIIGLICTYCIHLLIKAQYKICKRRKVPSLTYPLTAKFALMDGPPFLQKLAPFSGVIVNIFLLTYQLGTCCVYTVFIAEHVKAVCDDYFQDINLRFYMLIFLLPLIFINFIRNLKLLAPFTTSANLITLVSFVIILYYIILHGIKLEERPAFGEIKNLPLYFGTVLFALEAIGVIMPLENEMKTPKSFGGTFGVLNTAMGIIVFLYIGLGLFGYLAYGPNVSASITLNIGEGLGRMDKIAANVAKVMLALAIYISHALQMYVAIDITWNEYLGKHFQKSRYQTFYEYCIRVFLVLITFCLAVAFPELDLFISLFGALCLSALGMAFPALIDLSTNWDELRGASGKWKIARNLFLMIFAVFGLVVGTSTSLEKIIYKYTH